MAALPSSTLMGVFRDADVLPTFWMDRFFGRQVNFNTELIEFEKLQRGPRKLAPFVSPMSNGVPIFTEGSAVQSMKAAYTKLKDPITADRMVSTRPGYLLDRNGGPSAAQNHLALAAAIVLDHDLAITRREEWMAAQAIQFGKYTVAGDAYPARLVDFGRDAGHTETLGGSAQWGDVGVSILDYIAGVRFTMRRAAFGGPPGDLVMGGDAWEVFRKDAEVKALLDTQLRGSTTNYKRGLIDGSEVEYMGSLDGVLDLWVYSGFYVNEAGTAVDLLNPKAVVFAGNAVDGVRAYGAIKDLKAGLVAMPRFVKSWENEDPSVEFIMTQSSPLLVPVNPNNTYYAVVVE